MKRFGHAALEGSVGRVSSGSCGDLFLCCVYGRPRQVPVGSRTTVLVPAVHERTGLGHALPVPKPDLTQQLIDLAHAYVVATDYDDWQAEPDGVSVEDLVGVVR